MITLWVYHKCATITEAAKQAGTSEGTLDNWLKVPEFQFLLTMVARVWATFVSALRMV
jgi:hypothetical protein